MEELITDAQAEVIVAVAAAGLLIAAGGAWLLGRERWTSRVGRRMALVLVILGPLLWGLWRLDALFIDWLGFDRLLRLAVELVLFVAIGAGLGLWVRRDRSTN